VGSVKLMGPTRNTRRVSVGTATAGHCTSNAARSSLSSRYVKDSYKDMLRKANAFLVSSQRPNVLALRRRP